MKGVFSSLAPPLPLCFLVTTRRAASLCQAHPPCHLCLGARRPKTETMSSNKLLPSLNCECQVFCPCNRKAVSDIHYTNIFLAMTLGLLYCYHPHSAHEETEAHRGPELHSTQRSTSRSDPRSTPAPKLPLPSSPAATLRRAGEDKVERTCLPLLALGPHCGRAGRILSCTDQAAQAFLQSECSTSCHPLYLTNPRREMSEITP